jgi:signal transduction histidine kinase
MFIKYLRGRWTYIAGFMVFAGIFLLMSWLYDVPAEGMLYTMMLCGFFGAAFLLYGYYRYYGKVKKLEHIRKSIPYGNERFPPATDAVDEEYQQIADRLLATTQEAVSKLDSVRSDMVDYYTMWVHQIKTPIAALGLLIQSEDFPGKAEMKLELMKIEEYVDMVLQYLRLDSEQTDYLFRKHDVDTIIKEVLKKYSVVFIKKKIALDYTPVGITAVTDEKWLAFIIGQVISNALKYTDSGSISIYCGGGSSLVIEDTGIGIKDEDIPRVFDRGFTGYNGRNDKKSTGIGLYLCATIASKLGHSISVESEVGRGTKVMIDLSYKDTIFE